MLWLFRSLQYALCTDYRGCVMAKYFLVKYQATSSAVSAGNHVEKEINSRHALMGTGPQTATGTCPCHPARQPT